MASSSDRSVTESIRDEFLSCHICLEVFTDPRILPCLHTYCFQCICTHVATAQTEGRPVVCPECREPFSEVVSSLKRNFFVNGLTDVVKEKSSARLLCTSCNLRGDDSAAEVKCIDCGDYLCSTCSDGHNASSLTWKHEKIPLHDIRQGTYDEKLRQLQKLKCQKHEEKDVEFYCESCSKSVCLTCVLLDHRDHKCKTISEAVSDKRSNIGDLTEKLRESLLSFTNEENKVSNSLDILLKISEKENLEVEKQAEQEIANINAKKKRALKKISKRAKAAEKTYESQLEALRLRKSLVTSCVNFSDNILQKGKDEEVLMLESMLTDRLLYLQMDTEVNKDISGSNLDHQHTLQEKTSYASKVAATPLRVHIGGMTDQTHKPATGKMNQAANKPATNAYSNAVESDVRVQLKIQNVLSVKCSTDSSKPTIKGMVYSSNIGLVVSDRCNSKLKILDTSGEIQGEITTTGFQPFAVAVAGDVIAAVSENFLILFSSSGSLKRKVRLAEDKPSEDYLFTYSLAASETVGFVVGNIHGGNRLVFYNLEGKFIRFLYCSVQYPLAALSITPEGDIVLSEWGAGRIRVISPEGKLRFKTKSSEWRPNGTTTSEDGITFVADYEKGAVLAYSSNGEVLLDHSTRSDEVGNPKYVTIDENGFLYVIDYAGRVCVYKVVSN